MKHLCKKYSVNVMTNTNNILKNRLTIEENYSYKKFKKLVYEIKCLLRNIHMTTGCILKKWFRKHIKSYRHERKLKIV